MDEKQPDNKNSEKHSNESSTIPEIRYLPIDYLPELNNSYEEDEIDLMELFLTLWSERKTIIKITSGFIIVGLFWALFSPLEYESQAVLMPEVQEQSVSGAGRLLKQFGLGGGATGLQNGLIPPMIYPEIVSSTSFQLSLLKEKITFSEYEVTTTWPDFLENHYSTPVTAIVLDYTIKLPLTLLGHAINLFKTEEIEEIDENQNKNANYIRLSKIEKELILALTDRISVAQDQKNGLLTITTKLQDPVAAAEMNRAVIELLKKYVIEYKVEKAKQDLTFAEEQKKEAEEEFNKKQMALAQFRDQNVSLTTARAQTDLERLQDEKNLALSVYSSLAQRVEQAKLNVQSQMPVFKEVEPVSVPVEKSEPKRAMLMVIFTMLGGIYSIGHVFIKPFITKLKQDLAEAR